MQPPMGVEAVATPEKVWQDGVCWCSPAGMVFAGAVRQGWCLLVQSGRDGWCGGTWKSSLSWQTSEEALLTVNTQLPVFEGV